MSAPRAPKIERIAPIDIDKISTTRRESVLMIVIDCGDAYTAINLEEVLHDTIAADEPIIIVAR